MTLVTTSTNYVLSINFGKILPLELTTLVINLLDDSSLFAFHYTLNDTLCRAPLKKIQRGIIKDAISKGYEKLVKWMFTLSMPHPIDECDMKVFCEVAAESNQLDILKYLIPLTSKDMLLKVNGILDAGIRSGNLELVNYLHDKGCPLDIDAFTTIIIAAEIGNVEILQYLRDIGYSWNANACGSAAKNGHMDVLKYLHENGCPWDSTTCSDCTKGGHLEILKWLHKNNCPWDEWSCASAAYHNQFEILKYLHEHNCPWDDKSTNMAAGKGHMEILKYLIDHKCPMTKMVCWNAVKDNQLEALKYILDNGCPIDKKTCIECAHDDEIRQYLLKLNDI